MANPNDIRISYSMGALPAGYAPGAWQEFADAIAARLQGALPVDSGFIRGIESATTPTQDVGIWLPGDGRLMLWDDASSRYVPSTAGVGIGDIVLCGGVNAIDTTRYVLCDGASYPRSAPYDQLFAKIGVAHGDGDGTSTFNVPDVKGRAAIGSGQGTGLSNRVLGAKSGFEQHALTIAEVPTLQLQAVQEGTGSNVNTAKPAFTPAVNGAVHNNMPPSIVLIYKIRYK